MKKDRYQCLECSYNGTLAFMQGCPLAQHEICDGKHFFKQIKEKTAAYLSSVERCSNAVPTWDS